MVEVGLDKLQLDARSGGPAACLLEPLAARVEPGHLGARPRERDRQPSAAAARIEHPPCAGDGSKQLGRAERQLLLRPAHERAKR